MKTSKVGLTLLLVCCVWAVFIVAGCTKDEVDTTGTIYGIVNDADNGEPVSGVYIVLNPGGKTANTGSDGRFEFLAMEPGQYTIQISKNGYKTNTKRISVVAGEQTSGDMVLERGESRIKLSTNSLIFAKGETSKTFDIMNIGTSGSVSWSVAFSESWIKIAPVSGTTSQGKSSTVVVNIDREKITQDVTANLLVEADGESMPVAISVKFGESEGGGGDEPSEGKGSCGEIVSCDSEVKIEFLSCVKNADAVEFQFLLTNNREDWQVWFNRDQSDGVDDKGNSYPGYNTKFYVGNSDSFVTNGNAVRFMKGVSTKCRVIVPGIKNEASSLQRLDWVISSSQPWNPQVKKITFTEVKW